MVYNYEDYKGSKPYDNYITYVVECHASDII